MLVSLQYLLFHLQIPISSSGSKRDCKVLPVLRNLDLSHNGINGVTSQQMAHWPQIQDLNLANNYLRTVEKTAFEFSVSLKKIDMSNNQLNR